MNHAEQTFVFSCGGESMVGVVAQPPMSGKVGILIVVGGPQYRVGSHRQFLHLSRALAAAGYPAMRFDCRGMGDSTGEPRNFESLTEDIAAAIAAFTLNCPQVERVVLWGLCDAASASLMYWDETRDPRLSGLVLLNPWVRSEATLARAHIKHYYGQRLLQVEFWRKMLTGNLGLGRALSGFLGSLKNARQEKSQGTQDEALSFQERMARGFDLFPGPVLLLLSGNDYTAKEFLEAVLADPKWTSALREPRITRSDIVGADHTFSSRAWREQVENITKEWLDAKVAR
ncbi:hydrolase 1, exosortase A system-associated [Dechloromonas sp. A34]|uniref:hydrolase 1, exosortase A system-associated n=1 Tax=Dechloromonas sp. A34 TaxID=447588 RepID=UPI002248E42D|nr:hydrolase 1, exosortase A system-associated [Dechloromonas sp. A34]